MVGGRLASRSGLGKLRHLETHTLWLQEKVRTKMITVRKVWGEVNPADLFTKHLPSREKVHQLLNLFGCEYREGRAEAAPLLRPLNVDGRQGGHSVDDSVLSAFVNDACAGPHDATRLPHKHSDAELDKYFPIITAAPLVENAEDWNGGELTLESKVDRKCGNEVAQRDRNQRRRLTLSSKCDFG